MIILVNTDFANPALPQVASLGEQVKALDSLAYWLRGDAADCTLAGAEITKFDDRGGGAAGFSQGTSAQRAVLTANQIGGFGAAVFDGARRYSWAGGDAPDFSNPFTIAAVFKASAAPAADQYLLASFTNVGQSLLLLVRQAGAVELQHGSGYAQAPYTRGTWCCAICSSSGSLLTMRVNGATVASGATNNVHNPGTLTLGSVYSGAANQPFHGSLSDLLLFDEDLLAPGAAASLSLVERMLQKLYALDFEPLSAP